MFRIVHKRWRPSRLEVPNLIIDGPAWLRNRPAVVDALHELLTHRAASGRRSIVIQNNGDGSIEYLMDRMKAGSMVVLGLRFPKGPRGRLRFARRICDDLGVPREAARGTHTLDPWNYTRVLEHIHAAIADQAPAKEESVKAESQQGPARVGRRRARLPAPTPVPVAVQLRV